MAIDMARRVLWSTAVAASTGCHPNDGDATDSSSINEHFEIDSSHLGEWNVSVELPSLSLCSGCDLTIDWSELTTDLVGDTIDPNEDATHLSLYVFDSGAQAELVEGLVAQTLDQSQMMARWACPTSNSQALLSDCAFVGHSLNPEEYFVEDWGLWLLLLHGGSPSRLWPLGGGHRAAPLARLLGEGDGLRVVCTHDGVQAGRARATLTSRSY